MQAANDKPAQAPDNTNDPPGEILKKQPGVWFFLSLNILCTPWVIFVFNFFFKNVVTERHCTQRTALYAGDTMVTTVEPNSFLQMPDPALLNLLNKANQKHTSFLLTLLTQLTQP